MDIKQFKVLMICSEFTPFLKSGGLGDMVSALSVQLVLEGHDVTVVIPRYYDIDRSILTRLPNSIMVPIGFGQLSCSLYTTNFKGVKIYFIEHEELYGRKGIYGPTPDQSFGDNAKRYTLLNRASFEICRMIKWIPDIIHAHDWAAALAPVYLQTWEREREFTQTASLFSIHNLGYQGCFSYDDLYYSQLNDEDARRYGLEDMGSLNFMRAALISSDIITTVSPTYAKEITTSVQGFGLDTILRRRHDDLFGILNGVSYEEWNPSCDEYIKPYNFSPTDMVGKKKMKALLQQECGFEVKENRPLIGMVSRFAEQKGFGQLAGPSHGPLYSLCHELDIQVVIAGTGDRWCEEELMHLASKLPNLRVFVKFNNALAHRIEAGSDFFLMPSIYEPCGLNQLYSLKYGTIPIIHATGGLADSVEAYEEGRGTGFLFNNLTPQGIYEAVKVATDLYHYDHKEYIALQQRAMMKNFSWEKSAKRYLELYQLAKDRKDSYHSGIC